MVFSRFEKKILETPALVGGWLCLRRKRGLREYLAEKYLSGSGIEVGALNRPLKVPKNTQVKYVDKFCKEDLTGNYLNDEDVDVNNFAFPDIIDDGETLGMISDFSQDFVIANHLLEHLQDPIRGLINFFRVLKTGGILFLSIPDKRYTFDKWRPVTTIEHLRNDYYKGPEASREGHLREWVELKEGKTGGDAQERLQEWRNNKFGIHYHVWTGKEILETLKAVGEEFGIGFLIECHTQVDADIIFILRKTRA